MLNEVRGYSHTRWEVVMYCVLFRHCPLLYMYIHVHTTWFHTQCIVPLDSFCLFFNPQKLRQLTTEYCCGFHLWQRGGEKSLLPQKMVKCQRYIFGPTNPLLLLILRTPSLSCSYLFYVHPSLGKWSPVSIVCPHPVWPCVDKYIKCLVINI